MNLVRDREHCLKKSGVFCMAPWVHLCIPPDGRVFQCCFSPWDMPVGNLREQTLAEVWNSGALRRIRLNMLSGRESPECARCYELDKLGHSNLRSWVNADFAHHFPLVSATRDDGSVARLNLPYLDVRFSNLCNFRCRVCTPGQSSAWYEDGALTGTLSSNQPKVLTPTADPEDLWRQLEPLIPSLERIYFTGGEPLIMEHHYRLLNLLIEKKMFNVELVYNTNFSQTSYAGQDALPLWDKFRKVQVYASLDALGGRGEYLRKGQDWAQVLANRARLMKICPRTDFKVTCTLSAMNALHLPDFHSTWVEQGHIKPDDLYINILFWPDEYRMQILPRHLKEEVAKKYEKHLEAMSGLSKEKQSDFRAAVSFMQAQDKSGLLGKFRQRVRQLDQIRGESFAAVFPELEELMLGGD